MLQRYDLVEIQGEIAKRILVNELDKQLKNRMSWFRFLLYRLGL